MNFPNASMAFQGIEKDVLHVSVRVNGVTVGKKGTDLYERTGCSGLLGSGA